MTAPKLSVMLTFHNAQWYLQEAIDSILSQTFGDFELLLLDDASTDSSLGIVQSYDDPRIRTICHTTKHGIALSRKILLELARGEYVAVLDSDDRAYPARFDTQLKYLDSHADIDLIGSAYHVIDAGGKVIALVRVPLDPVEIRWRLLFGNCLGHSAVMYRKESALRRGGYDEHVVAGEDYDLWIRLARDGKIAQLDVPLVQWRSHKSSVQRTEPPEAKKYLIQSVIKSIQLLAGVSVDWDVARCLFSDIPGEAENRATVLKAYTAVVECLGQFLNSQEIDGSNRRRLQSFAVEEIFRVALQNPGSFADAWRAAERCTDPHHRLSAVTPRVVRRALVAASPRWAARHVRRMAQPF